MQFFTTVALLATTLGATVSAYYDFEDSHLQVRASEWEYPELRLYGRDLEHEELAHGIAARDIEDIHDLFVRALEIRTKEKPKLKITPKAMDRANQQNTQQVPYQTSQPKEGDKSYFDEHARNQKKQGDRRGSDYSLFGTP